VKRRFCILVVTANLILLSSACSNLISNNDDHSIETQLPTITQPEINQYLDATETLEVSENTSETPPIWTDGLIFPDDAEIEIHSRRHGVVYTSLSVDMATEFMLPQLENNGWLLEKEPSLREDSYHGRFVKDDKRLKLSIEPETILNLGTGIRISIDNLFGLWTHKDIPLPEDAVVEISAYDFVTIRTSLDVEDAIEYMLEQLKIKGWIVEEMTSSDDTFFATFTLGKKHLELTIVQYYEPDLRAIRLETNGGEWKREDVPLPKDAEIESASESMVEASTNLSFVDARNFMLTQLETNGWCVEKVSIDNDAGYWGDFVKGTELLKISIAPDTNTIILIVIE
jgi:hypothetical protein